MATNILTMPNQKGFESTFNFCEFLYQHSNNYAISLVCVREMVDLKMLESDWLIPFWPISQEQDFSKI